MLQGSSGRASRRRRQLRQPTRRVLMNVPLRGGKRVSSTRAREPQVNPILKVAIWWLLAELARELRKYALRVF